MTKLREEDVMVAEKMKGLGSSVRSLARSFKVDESTLRYRLKRLGERAVDGRTRQVSVCSSYDEVVQAWIKEQEERVNQGERPLPVRDLHELLVSEHGYSASYKAVVRYVNRKRPPVKLRPVRRIEVRPGTQAQVDWIKVKANVAELGGYVELWVFVMVLSASRMWAAIWSRGKEMYSWIHCHNESLKRLGGVPLSIRPDNEKTATVKGGGPWAKINEGYASYAGQVGFVIDPSRIRKPRDKGKVERRNRDLKYVQIKSGEIFADIAALQRATDERILKRADRLTCPQTGLSVLESWKLERAELEALPETLPEAFDVQVRRPVGRDCLVSFEGRQYSVPFNLMDRTVDVRGAGSEVLIFHEGRLLKRYPRGTRARLLVEQADYEGSADERVHRPTPLGRLGREIVLQRSWEAPCRPIDHYVMLVGGKS